MLPVDVQQREDAALGAAWRRVLSLRPCEHYWISADTAPRSGFSAQMWRDDGAMDEGPELEFHGETLTEALTALADALEERR